MVSSFVQRGFIPVYSIWHGTYNEFKINILRLWIAAIFRRVKAANDVHRLGHAEAALNQYFPVDDTMPSTYNRERNKYASRPRHGKVRAFKLPD